MLKNQSTLKIRVHKGVPNEKTHYMKFSNHAT